MAIQLSTGLRNALLDTGSIKGTLDLGFIKIYTGTAPASADDAETGTLLCTISVDGLGGGISFDTNATSGSLYKAPGEAWQGTVGNGGGVAGYYRHIGASDTGVSSTTEPRIQGSIGVSGADMNFSDTTLVDAATQSIDYYIVTMPAS